MDEDQGAYDSSPAALRSAGNIEDARAWVDNTQEVPLPLLHCTKPSIEYFSTTCLLGRQDLQGITLKLLHNVAGNWQQGVGCCALYSAAHHPDSEVQLGPEGSREH